MKKPVTILILLIISFFGVGSLGLVWMRMKVSTIANECGDLEDELEIVAREVHELRAQRSRAMRPSNLASLVQGRLKMPDQRLTFHVTKEEMDKKIGKMRDVTTNKSYRVRGMFAGSN